MVNTFYLTGCDALIFITCSFPVTYSLFPLLTYPSSLIFFSLYSYSAVCKATNWIIYLSQILLNSLHVNGKCGSWAYLHNSNSLNSYFYIKDSNNFRGFELFGMETVLILKSKNNVTFHPQLIHNFKAGLFLHSS